jgi:thymidine phosphorylase
VAEAIDLPDAAGGARAAPARVTLALGAEMLVLGGLAADAAAGHAQLQAALDSGAAAERFARMVAALGGPADLMERPNTYLAAAPVVVPVPAPRAGVLAPCTRVTSAWPWWSWAAGGTKPPTPSTPASA